MRDAKVEFMMVPLHIFVCTVIGAKFKPILNYNIKPVCTHDLLFLAWLRRTNGRTVPHVEKIIVSAYSGCKPLLMKLR
jgi:hypothetical protein